MHKGRGPAGLTELRDDELKKLLGHIYREELSFPLTAQSIACIGFQHRHELLMATLRKVDAIGVQAVLVCIIAERNAFKDKQKKMQPFQSKPGTT